MKPGGSQLTGESDKMKKWELMHQTTLLRLIATVTGPKPLYWFKEIIRFGW